MIRHVRTLEADAELRATFGAGVRMLPLGPTVDERGRLVELDFSSVPFAVRRAFAISDVTAGLVRGGHRHRNAAQLLACIRGSITVELRRNDSRFEIPLDAGTGALYLAPGVWASQRYDSDEAVLLVLASERYDPADYETDY